MVISSALIFYAWRMGMDNKELKLLEDLKGNLDLYKVGLSEIIIMADKKDKAIERLSEVKEEISKYVIAGEVLHDITTNYVYLKPLLDTKGSLVGCQKCYSLKAEEAIKGNEDILSEATVEYEGEEYINLIKKELAKYKSNTVFTELQSVEEILSKVNPSSNFFKDNIKELLESIKEFNMLDEESKMEELDSFCSENLEYLKGSVVLMELSSDYKGVDFIFDVNMFEYGGLLSICEDENLAPILNWNEECHSRIMKDMEFLMEAREAEYDIELVKKQLRCVDELRVYIESVKN